MRPTVFRLFTTLIPAGLLLLDLAAPRSAGATTIDLSWNACSPLQPVVHPGGDPGPVSLFVSALGQEHPHLGYQFRFALSSPQDLVPDAWRFDAAGCQGNFGINYETRANLFVAKTCPTFAGPITTAEVRSFEYADPSTGVPANAIAGLISHTYAARFGPHEPTQRYFLGRVIFDHTFSINGPSDPGAFCGGFEQPICIELVPAQCWWLDMQEQPVGFAIGNGSVGFREFCGPVPAAPSTWGAIKGQYRR